MTPKGLKFEDNHDHGDDDDKCYSGIEPIDTTAKDDKDDWKHFWTQLE